MTRDEGDPPADDPPTTPSEEAPPTRGEGGDASPPATANGGATERAGPATVETGGLPGWVVAVLPIVLLGGLVAGVVVLEPMAGVESGQPLPDLTVTHVTLSEGVITLHVTNNGPGAVTIQQVLVDEAYWSFGVEGGDRTLGAMESARVVIPYHWEPGWDVEAALVLGDGATVDHTIVAPSASPGVTGETVLTLALLGVFVGIVPVALGMLWFPALQRMRDGTLHAVLAFSAGVLGFLAIDAGIEALELAERVPGAYEGPALVVLGAVGALLLVQTVSAWRRGRESTGDARRDGLRLAYLVAVAIGLHNLAEGLAIGSSFALGRVSLGAFLVIGFMVHNVTEGPAVVAPLASHERPSPWQFVALGLVAGGPVVLGGWIGGFAFSPTLGALFLAVGVGAIAQVVLEIAGMVRADGGRAATPATLLAFLAGLVVMYLTDLLVAI